MATGNNADAGKVKQKKPATEVCLPPVKSDEFKIYSMFLAVSESLVDFVHISIHF